MINAVGAAQSIPLLGGTSEISLAITAEFLREDPAKVILASLPNDPLREAPAEKMKVAGASEMVTLDFDATDFDSHPEIVDKAFADDDVDICIVAFGILGDTKKLWQNQRKVVLAANINYTGAMSVGVLVGQKFKTQDHGQFIAMSSVTGKRVHRSNFVYSSTRAGLDGFYLNLGEALEEYGVKTLAIRPDQVRTRMSVDADEAPLTANKEDITKLAVKSVGTDKTLIWAPPAFQLVIMVLKHILRPIFEKLPI